MEAAKGVPYRRLMLRAVQLKCIPAVEEKEYDTMYSIDGVHKTFNIRTVSNL